ncbi:MAG: ABC transporter permease, partial [Candidatus Zixiibacteriota bacterium]
MLKHYTKVVLRSLGKHKGYAAINICGLAIGLAAVFLTQLYVMEETTWDSCHINYDRIYRVIRSAEKWGITSSGNSFLVGPYLKENSTAIEQVARSRRVPCYVVKADNRTYEGSLFCADPAIFDIFTLPMLSGSPKSLTDNPSAVVISERIVKKYFGDENPLGKTISISARTVNADLTVVGTMRDLSRKSSYR